MNAIQEEVLMGAVERGVHCKNGVYRFFDPVFRSSSYAISPSPGSRSSSFTKTGTTSATGRTEKMVLRTDSSYPVEGSFGKTFWEQKAILTTDEEVASTRSVAAFLVINAVATGMRLLPNRSVRCIDAASDSERVFVGLFDSVGFYVSYTGLAIATTTSVSRPHGSPEHHLR